jgi:histidinol-phosphate/aromatic aminotransferase/cobyric acid decarboxylase-like protein
MIYLDGSRFFFDIEGCFSNLCEKVREENKNSEADKNAAELCKGFAKFFGTKPEFVRAGKDYKTVLSGIFGEGSKAVVPEFDISAENFVSAFKTEPVFVKKSSDMKIKAENLAEAAKENDADFIYLSNPCCPTGLEIAPAEVQKLCSLTEAKVVIDESFCVDESVSVLSTVPETENLIVLKKMRFGGDPVFACGRDLLEFDCGISASEQAVGTVIFEKNSALKTAQRKLTDSRDSLYIRIKKLAIKFDSLERLYRAKGNCVFFKVKDAEERAKKLFDMGISVYSKDGYFCVFAVEKDENEAVLKALEEVLK